MTAPVDIVEDIFNKLKIIQGKSHAEIITGDHVRLPRLIPSCSSGGTIQIDKEIDDLITYLAHKLKTSRPLLLRMVRANEWRSLVRSNIGPILAKTRLSTPDATAAPAILDELNDLLTTIISTLSDREYAFGTTLFANHHVAPFMFGPVNFEPRSIWLQRKAAEGNVSSIASRRIQRVWSGSNLRPRKINRDQMQERDIITAIGNCPYVCSVKLSANFAPDAGLETALVIARLALVATALAFEDTSKILSGFNLQYDGPIYAKRSLFFVLNKPAFAGSKLSRDPEGPFISALDWEADLLHFSNVFSAASSVFYNAADPDRKAPRAVLLEALMQSMSWLEKGCRETSDQIAIVDFAASLDALGKGTKIKGILDVLDARLGWKSTDPINAGGPALQSVLEAIYNEVRSRTIHGTSNKIGFDWAATRRQAEQLARYALIACLDYTSKSTTASTTDDLKK